MGLDSIRARLRRRGQITLPPEVRHALGVEDGDIVEFTVDRGHVELHALRLIPADQAWFWTESWQRGEREASEDLAAGRVDNHYSDEAFLKSLED